MMKKLSVFTFLLLLTTTACGDITRVSVTVVDDDGKPVENAKIIMSYLRSHDEGVTEGYTNKQGKLSSMEIQRWGVSMSAMKEGYYRSSLRTSDNFSNTRITLRQKKNPVPMHCKAIKQSFIGRETTTGFDLIVGDWVAPHGKGNTTHMEIYFDSEYKDVWNFSGEMHMHFTNLHDGLLVLENPVYESKFRFPYIVPQGDYQNNLLQTLSKTKEGEKQTSHRTYKDDLLGYALRLNTKLDQDGNVISANYGRINGDIYFSPATLRDGRLGILEFTYCYNPVPNQKSLEVSENLAKSKQ